MKNILFDIDDDFSPLFLAIQMHSEIVNFETYGISSHRLRGKIQGCIIAIWSVKDWMKEVDFIYGDQVETEINKRYYLPIVADLANTIKHKKLTKFIRSGTGAKPIDKHGAIYKVNMEELRRLWYIDDGKGKEVEIFPILTGAIDEWTDIMYELRKSS